MQPKFIVVRVEQHVQSEDVEAGYRLSHPVVPVDSGCHPLQIQPLLLDRSSCCYVSRQSATRSRHMGVSLILVVVPWVGVNLQNVNRWMASCGLLRLSFPGYAGECKSAPPTPC